MSLGLEDEIRPWPRTRKSDRVITKDIPDKPEPDKYCWACGLKITGKIYRVSEGVYECFRCHNE